MAWARITSTSQEPAPSAITVALASPAAAGNVDNGVHRYLCTFTTSDGETQAGVVSAAVTVADKTINGKVQLSAIPLGGALVTSRKLYRTTAGGSTYLLLATLADNTTTTYLDNIADASLGAGAPSTNTTLDPMLSMMISAARGVAESRTGRRLISQTWEQVIDAFPCNELKLDIMPVQSVVSVTYIDEDGNPQVMDSDQYVLDKDTLTAWLLPAYGESWPSTQAVAQAVVVRVLVGYGDTGASVPAELRQWIAAQVAASFDNPAGLLQGQANALPYIDGLLDAFDIRMGV
jgi:uncharacterized phiE125 gp8 family phage protein